MSKGSYVCQRAAHAIIAEFGPLRVSSDALQAINLFLDELLEMIMTSALSFELGRIKEIVIKLLPKKLGRNSLVEAEIELKQQMNKQTVSDEALSDYERLCLLGTKEGESFPIHDAIMSLQESCSNHCSLSDKNHNKHQHQHQQQEDQENLITIMISPVVVIYVTAVVEHIAEYILNLVARTADQADTEHIRVKEVLAALLDDIQVTDLFRQMTLKEKLEKRASVYQNYFSLSLPSTATNPVPLTRDQYIRRNSSPSSTSQGDLCPDNDDFNKIDQGDDENDHRPRVIHSSNCSIKSSESVNDRPLSIMSSGTVKSSGSKSRFNFFGIRDKRNSITLNFTSSIITNKRSSIQHSQQQQQQYQQQQQQQQPTSIPSPTAPSLPPLSTDFDDLIRSGNTRKVTLTPNRLRSIEVKEDNTNKLEPITTVTTTPWEKLTTPVRGRSFKKNLDSPPPLPPLPRMTATTTTTSMPIPPTPTVTPPSSAVATTISALNLTTPAETSPPLTPASSVASRPSQRSRHSIMSSISNNDEKSDRSKSSKNSISSSFTGTNEEILVEETTNLMRSPFKLSSSRMSRRSNSSRSIEGKSQKTMLFEKPSVMLSKRTSLGSRPPSFHEGTIDANGNPIINTAGSVDGGSGVQLKLVDGSIIKRNDSKNRKNRTEPLTTKNNNRSEEESSERQEVVVYVMPNSPLTLTRSSLSNHTLATTTTTCSSSCSSSSTAETVHKRSKDKTNQTTDINVDVSTNSIETREGGEDDDDGDEEWFIQEDDWNDNGEEEKVVAEWLLGNV